MNEDNAHLCGPGGRHDCPDPTDGIPTSCPCGRVRKIPAPSKEPRP